MSDKAEPMSAAMADSLIEANGVCPREGCGLTRTRLMILDSGGVLGHRLVCVCCDVGDANGCPHGPKA